MVVLILFCVILYYFLPIFLEEPTQQTVSLTGLTTKTSKPTPAATWHEIAHWKGKSIKNTETFHIPSLEWRILWSTKPGEYGDMNFQIYVYNSAESLIDVAANVIGENKDSSFMRGSGDYYLKINTGQPSMCEIAYHKLKGEDIEPLLKEARKESLRQEEILHINEIKMKGKNKTKRYLPKPQH